MPRRIRNIKPDFFEDELMAQLPLGARLFYIGLWTRCDLHGVFEWSPKVLCAAIFPHDDNIDSPQVSEWLNLLVSNNRVHRYEARGKQWGIVLQFIIHQKVSKKEKESGSSFPLPPKSPRPKDIPGKVPGEVPRTVPGSPDLGHRTYDVGRMTTEPAQPGSRSVSAPIRGAGQSDPGKDEVRAATLRAQSIQAQREADQEVIGQ